MEPSCKGVATYLQTFLLIAAAVGGSALAYPAINSYASSVSEPVILVSGASLRQGSSVALVNFAVSNEGPGAISTLTVSVSAIPSARTYCFSVWSLPTGSYLSTNCPGSIPNPSLVTLPLSLAPGASAEFLFTIAGAGVFQPGTAYQVSVLADSGAQASENIIARSG